MAALRAKSKMLTGYLEMLLTRRLAEQPRDTQHATAAPLLYSVALLTPSDPEQRGAQLSVRFSKHVLEVFEQLEKRGVVVSLFTLQSSVLTFYYHHHSLGSI
jgi:kynureninase